MKGLLKQLLYSLYCNYVKYNYSACKIIGVDAEYTKVKEI